VTQSLFLLLMWLKLLGVDRHPLVVRWQWFLQFAVKGVYVRVGPPSFWQRQHGD